MGLNGLVTRSIAGYVRKFRLWGEFKEYDLEECAKVGRVPDGSMMLNCLVRAAVEKMGVLESFRYDGTSRASTFVDRILTRPVGSWILRCFRPSGKDSRRNKP